MSKHDRKGRTRAEARHVRLYHWMLDSPAWRDLSCYARCALTVLYRRHNSANNGDVGLSVRELAADLRVALGTAQKALKDLTEHGFIEAQVEGSFDWKTVHSGKPTGRSTRWRLTEFPFEDSLPSKDFMRWQPSVSPDERQIQNAVSPGERRVSPHERSVSPGERSPPENRQSVSPGEPFEANSPQKCITTRTCIVNQVGSAANASALPASELVSRMAKARARGASRSASKPARLSGLSHPSKGAA